MDEIKREIDIETSNTEALLLEGFRKFGPALFGKMEGEFAISVLDRRRGRLYFSRDFAGKTPLYYYQNSEGIHLSRSLDALRKWPGFEARIDTTGLLHYLWYGFVLSPYTIYEQTYKIRQGCYIVYDFATRKTQEAHYWELDHLYGLPKLNISENEILKQTERILKKSVADQYHNDTDPAGVMLSGGYDSSLIAALLARQNDRKTEAFTIGFEEKSYDESRYAAKIAEYLGLKHHIFLFSEKEASRIVPSLTGIYEEPFADFGATPTVMLAQMAQKAGIKRLFVGDGGDEVFATADNLEQFRLFRNFHFSHRGVTGKILNLFDPLHLPLLSNRTGMINRYAKFRMLLQSESIPQMIKKKEMTFLPKELDRLLHLDSRSFPNAFDLIHFDRRCELADQITGTYFHTTMADGELVKTYGALSGAGITPLSPYLERNLIELLARTPVSLKLKEGIRKYLLKTLAHHYIPKELLERPKSGFDIPFGKWMRGILKEDLSERLSEQNIASTTFFDPGFVTDLKRRFYQGDDFVQYRLWNL
ncbi:MAG: hypothetical protein B6D59_06460, partial [Campylobacteraceae bacterium 4484_4]